ncbi:MAG: hypothetical protein KA388_11555 [Rhodocyclaceae bacterium]|nr:hypothetical protein [Rhodocyclaceae bacterium]MBP6110740.1 hypothetical protein [Rhodocyclaceae bacterium]MBP6280386.1 hypothetical protein [Rhodocyclaceae bacterium]
MTDNSKNNGNLSLGKRHSKVISAMDRRLGPTENIYCFLDKLYCLNFVCFAEISGSLTLDRINEALHVVQQEQPLLRARLELMDDRYWFKPVKSKDFPLRAEVAAFKDWRKAIAAQLDTPFSGNAPLARFFLFGGRGKKSVAAMVFHHAIADGKSGANILLEILRRAGGEEMPMRYQRAHPSAQDLDLIKSKSPLLGSLQKLRYWLNQGKSALKFVKQLPGFDMRVRPSRDIHMIPFEVSAKTSSAILTACRAHGTTVHGALGAAQVLAINDEFETRAERNLALNSLADLRGVLTDNLTEFDLGLYVATLTTVHEIATEPDFWSLAIDIRAQLKGILQSGDGNLVHGVYSETRPFPPTKRGAQMLHAVTAMAPSASMLTNIGKVDALTLADGTQIDSVAFAVTGPTLHPICVTATTYANRMYVNVVYDRLKLTENQALRITKSIRRWLDYAAKG